MTGHKNERRLKVAVIGGGPGGLGTALELAKLPFVDWELYEKKPQISETGGGISLQPNTWRLLEHNGAAKSISPTEFFRPADGLIEQVRNGRSGKLLLTKYNPKDVPPDRQTCRLVRDKLQSALLKGVDKTHVHVAMRLVGVEHIPDNRIHISFEDGFADEVDLLIGADGIRSVIRQFDFPDSTLRYNGQCVYRTIVSKAEVMKINGIPWAPTFWKHTSGLYVFTCPLGNVDFEVTARIRRPNHDVVSWGQPFDLHTLLHEYDDFCLPIRQLLHLAAEGETQEFALFSGKRLQRIVSHGNVALIGDASHPMLGYFGAGCGFALEDVYALTKTLDWAWSRNRPLADALDFFDTIRSSYYKRLYGLMNKYACIKVTLQEEDLPLDEEIGERVKRISLTSESWMYYYEIKNAVDEALCGADRCIRSTQATIKSAEQIVSNVKQAVHADGASEGEKATRVTENMTELQVEEIRFTVVAS